MLETLSQAITAGVLRVGLPLLLLVIATVVALRLVNLAAAEVDKRLIATTDDPDQRARLHTLRRAAKNTIRVVILVIAVLIGLGTIGVDIGPALAAAGIAGLTISLGAQTLIKDVIGGLTVLIEDEYRVGDTVQIGSVSGDVERITLRRTDVRDAEGRLFVVPNGEVRVVANETRDWSRALVELNFDYAADVQKAMSVLDEALMTLENDPRVKPYLLDRPEIFGWNALSDWAVQVRLRAKVTAGKRNEVARVMRQVALEALHAAGVRVESHSRSVGIVLQSSDVVAAGAKG
jgi:small conductance mechanosensitive channel